MSSSLLIQFRQLSPDKISELRHYFRDAPKATMLLDFLINQKGTSFNTRDAVLHVYGSKPDNKDYAVYENRYYKLRKKIETKLKPEKTISHFVLTEEENELLEAKLLLANGRFAEAEKILMQTEKKCYSRNIFELLPEVIDLRIQIGQSLNKIQENKLLHEKFYDALNLYRDIMEVKNITRTIYEVNFRHGIKAAEPLYRRMAKIERKHKQYPRFNLIYNFVSGYYKVGAGSPEYLNRTNVTNRHIGVARKLMQQFPEMPATNYSLTAQATQNYRLMELQTMSYYNAMRYKEAAEEMLLLYEKVIQPESPMKRLKTEILFNNSIHMMVAAGRYGDGLNIAKEYLKFLVSNKRHELLHNAYLEIANIHVSMYPQQSGYDHDSLMKRLNAIIEKVKKNKENYLSKPVWITKLKLLVILKKYPEAKKLLLSSQAKLFQGKMQFRDSFIKLIELKSITQNTEVQKALSEFKSACQISKNAAKSADEFLHWRWMEKMCGIQ